MICSRCRTDKTLTLQCTHRVCLRCLNWKGTGLWLRCPICRAKTREASDPHESELSSMQSLVLGIVNQALKDLTAPRLLRRRKRRVIAQTGLPPKRFAFSYQIASERAEDARAFLLHGLWDEECPYRHVLLKSDGIPILTRERMTALVRERMTSA